MRMEKNGNNMVQKSQKESNKEIKKNGINKLMKTLFVSFIL